MAGVGALYNMGRKKNSRRCSASLVRCGAPPGARQIENREMKINKTRIVDLIEVIGIRWLSLAVNVLIALVVVAGIAATLGIVCKKGVLDNNILEESMIYLCSHDGLKELGVGEWDEGGPCKLGSMISRMSRQIGRYFELRERELRAYEEIGNQLRRVADNVEELSASSSRNVEILRSSMENSKNSSRGKWEEFEKGLVGGLGRRMSDPMTWALGASVVGGELCGGDVEGPSERRDREEGRGITPSGSMSRDAFNIIRRGRGEGDKDKE